MRQTKVSFCSHLARANRRRGEEGRKEEEEEEEEEGEDKKVCFYDGIKCILMSRVIGMEIVTPCARVLWRDHINPRILEVLWVKPQLVENKHGIIIFIWFLEELVDLGLNS